LEKDEADGVIVPKIDRLSRNLRDFVNLVYDWVDKGIYVRSVVEAFADTS
ncbi:MAG: recombinase family protein, partial [Nitrososphaeria archaeon]|nr:recombinase family protein [Nitrososphaeria archaeon]